MKLLYSLTLLTLVCIGLVVTVDAVYNEDEVDATLNQSIWPYLDYEENQFCFQRASRENGIYSKTFHVIMNVFKPTYTLPPGVTAYAKPHTASAAAALIQAAYLIRVHHVQTELTDGYANLTYWNPAFQTIQIQNVTNQVPVWLAALTDTAEEIANGITFGTQVANDMMALQEGDNYNVVPEGGNTIGTPPAPGAPVTQWYSANAANGWSWAGGVYGSQGSRLGTNPAVLSGQSFTNWASVVPEGIPPQSTWNSSSPFYCPPPPAYTDPKFAASLNITYILGGITNAYGLRNSYMQNDISIGVAAPFNEYAHLIMAQLVNNPDVKKPVVQSDGSIVYNKLTSLDKQYIYLKVDAAVAASVIWVKYWKNEYMVARPVQRIHFGDGACVVDPTWAFFANGAPDPEWPCGHCAMAKAMMVALQLALQSLGIITAGTDQIPGGSYCVNKPITFDGVASAIHMCVSTFSEIARIIQARIPMHTILSGEVAQSTGGINIPAFMSSTYSVPL